MALPALALGVATLAQPPELCHTRCHTWKRGTDLQNRGEQGWHESYSPTTHPAQHRA